ncbi:dihydroorotate dehydrogenase electron transfer subunit [Geomicrobium halophilum]|uniref:Dihydroorotate dehydrogenase B (NAD(+)), electron transfer subunit n=1 Tax=Geomicrobium halophilum TaxID=549000 RepID=A0A841PST5_9BACL|nr:dihydroorotate dehydrogenase electron transfer subunit [Geomicrobium halophilum]MBB6449361.1 dihydroorotate dehydrogenase electron transfer subunit [Geomicrobium halophilum]
MRNEMMTVAKNQEIAANTYELTLSGALVNDISKAGTFLHIEVPGGDLVLRRPISIASVDPVAGTCTLVYKEMGEGTKRLARCRPGDLLAVLGPLGNTGFPVESPQAEDHVLLIGGGVGVPPLYYAAYELAKRKVTFTVILGFQTKAAVFYEEQFRYLPGSEVQIMTDDGSYGGQGTVIDALKTRTDRPAWLFSCGPRGMLRALEIVSAQPGTKGYVSLEERMGCGVGACLACVCETADRSSYRKICQDGPVFAFKEVLL